MIQCNHSKGNEMLKGGKENDRIRLRTWCRRTAYTDNAFQIIQARDKRSISKGGMKNDDRSAYHWRHYLLWKHSYTDSYEMIPEKFRLARNLQG